MAHVLLIDDDAVLIPEQVRQAFPAPAHRVEVAGTGAAGLALAAATSPAPTEDPAHSGRLRLGVGGLAFPYYERTAGWETTGARTDALRGRRVVTVFYTARGHRVGYAIVSGAPLPAGGGTLVTRNDLTYWLRRVHGAQVITWRQAGHTCVIAGRRVSPRTLLGLASAEERQAA